MFIISNYSNTYKQTVGKLDLFVTSLSCLAHPHSHFQVCFFSFLFFFKKNFIYKSFSKKYKLNIPLIYYQQTPQNIKLPFSGNVSVLINTTLSILSDWTFSLLQPFSLLNISTQLFFLKSLKTIEKLERF